MTSDTTEPIASVIDASRQVTRHGGTTTLLQPVTFDLPPATIVALAGPSGSGKTTLCNVIIGWETPDSGRVEWHREDAVAWARLSVAPQRLALLGALSVRENLALPFWSARRPVPEDELGELAAALAIDGLLERRPAEISFGEQQRAAIARCLAGSPALAVLDEPTGHQDEARAALVVDALRTARDRGTCVVVATHDATVIAAADQVIRLHPT